MSYSYEYSYSTNGGSTNGAAQGASLSGGASSYESYSTSHSGNLNQVATDLLSLAGNRASAGSAGSATGSIGLAGSSYSSSTLVSSSGGNASSNVVVSGSVSSSGSIGVFLSQIEQAILRSTVPIDVSETEEITVLGQRGIWANRAEVVNWRGEIPITQYIINEDSNPEVITKRVSQSLEYIQELAIRYLRPPTPPVPGEIVIIQQENSLTAPAPPLVIRQQPPRPNTPEPLVVREAPPQPPQSVGRKVITISGKRAPPPPRKVVIERLAPLPAKPQSVVVERWLPYSQVKRRVVYQRSQGSEAVVIKPRNVIVQWEAPQVSIKKEVKYLGVIRANPVEYVQRYGASLKISRDLPQFVLDIKTPDGLVLAADYRYNSVFELEGDLQAFRLVDLDREGLSEYRAQLQRLGISFDGGASTSSSVATSVNVSAGAQSLSSSTHNIVSEVFAQLDVDKNGSLSIDEGRRAFLILNSKFGRAYNEDDVAAFFRTLDTDRNGSLSLIEFRAAFERLIFRADVAY